MYMKPGGTPEELIISLKLQIPSENASMAATGKVVTNFRYIFKR